MIKKLLFGCLVALMCISISIRTEAATQWGQPVTVFGAALESNEASRSNVATILGTEDGDIASYVRSEDVQNYIGVSYDDSILFSSIRIQQMNEGYGLNVTIDDSLGLITQITEEMYQNALLTAGVTNAEVVIAAPHDVTGESALTGIYKAYEEQGEAINTERTTNAQEELNTISQINNENSEKDGFSQEQLNAMITQIKIEIINNGGDLSEEEIRNIVDEQIQNYGLDGVLTEDQINRIVVIIINIKDSGLFVSEEATQLKESSQNLLNEITSNENYQDAIERAKELGQNVKESNAFQSFIDAIKNFFRSILDFFK